MHTIVSMINYIDNMAIMAVVLMHKGLWSLVLLHATQEPIALLLAPAGNGSQRRVIGDHVGRTACRLHLLQNTFEKRCEKM